MLINALVSLPNYKKCYYFLIRIITYNFIISHLKYSLCGCKG
jgi:uncharacterized protein YerC